MSSEHLHAMHEGGREVKVDALSVLYSWTVVMDECVNIPASSEMQ